MIERQGQGGPGCAGTALNCCNSFRSMEDASRRVCSNLGGLAELAALNEVMILLAIQIAGTGHVGEARHVESDLRVVERAEDVWDGHVLIHVDAKNLVLSGYTDNAACRLMLGSNGDGLAGDVLHVPQTPASRSYR